MISRRQEVIAQEEKSQEVREESHELVKEMDTVCGKDVPNAIPDLSNRVSSDEGVASTDDKKDVVELVTPQNKGPARKRYSREFLLQIRGKCNVPPPQIISKPCFKTNIEKRGRGEPHRIIPHGFCEDKIQLKKADRLWQRPGVLQLGLRDKQKETQKVFRQFQSVLNKLTPQKFDKLAAATLQLPINTEERLRGVVDMIFTRAASEALYCEVYANLCRVLASITVETVNAEGEPVAVTFRRLLLTKCQQEFEKDKQDDAEREVLQEKIKTAETEEIKKQREMELEAAEVASRHRSLGNIRFMGELYKLKILSEFIMHECVIRLLKSTSDEESLERFAKLMTVAGRDLDKEESKQRIDAYFNRVNDIIRKGKISKRVKFALQDVVELTDNRWIPRRHLYQLHVKTIDQIHREVEKEEQQQHSAVTKHNCH